MKGAVELVTRHADIPRMFARRAVRQFARLRPYAEDLRQEGAIGLMKAAELYRSDSEASFRTFAWWVVRTYVSRAVARLLRQEGAPERQLEELACPPAPTLTTVEARLLVRRAFEDLAVVRGYRVRQLDILVFLRRLVFDETFEELAARYGLSRARVHVIERRMRLRFERWVLELRRELE